MKRLIAFLWLLSVGGSLSAFFLPNFHGARSLALGFSGRAGSLDTDAQELNPALWSQIALGLSGYQFQTTALSPGGFNEGWNDLRGMGGEGFLALSETRRADLWDRLRSPVPGRPALWGGERKRISGGAKGSAFSISWIDEALYVPVDSSLWSKNAAELTATDLAQLAIRRTGWNYVQYAASFAFPISASLNVGVTGRYLKGKGGTGQELLLGQGGLPSGRVRERLQVAWSSADSDFKKILFDASLSLAIGDSLLAGLVVENVLDGKVSLAGTEVAPPRRAIVALAFRPTPGWGFFLDSDVARSALFYTDWKSQPISFGIERSFFQQALSLRVGMRNDLSEEYFLGRKANVLFGLGIGIQLAQVVVDGALALDRDGRVRSVAVSGFLRFGKTN